MIDFGTALESKLANTATEAGWFLKLFYNAGGATDFIGVSDGGNKIVIGGVTYHGLATWGGYGQRADLLNFAVSQGAMNLTLANGEGAILGGRFSDLFATKNFVNRKWELYMGSGGTLSTETVGQGLISSDIAHDDSVVTMRLLHRKYTNQIPANVIDGTVYTDAPAENVGAPIPMAYGDFSPTNADATVGLDKRTVKNMFPAIISNAIDIDAKPDSQVLNSLDDRLVAIRDDKNFAFCIDSAVTVLADTSGAGENVGPLITFGGTDYRIPLKVNNVEVQTESSNEQNAIDDDLTTDATFQSLANGAAQTNKFFLDPISGSGVPTDVIVSISNDSAAGVGSATADYSHDGVETFSGTTAELYVAGAVTDDDLNINAANRVYPSAGGSVRLSTEGDVGTSQGTMVTEEFTADLQISPKQTFVQQTIKEQIVQGPFGSSSILFTTTDNREFGANTTFKVPWITMFGSRIPWQTVIKETILNAPANLEYIFYSGKGREYGSWISDGGRSVGYASGALIENPIYMVEDAIRTEVSVTDIDTDTFDESGNTTNGFIGDTFDLAVGSVLFALAQKSFVSLEGFWNQIGAQCATLFFVSGSGKIKAKTRRRKADYDALTEGDFTAQYGHITPGKSFMTSINDVRNSITTKFGYDYPEDKTTDVTAAVTDGTSQGTGVTGYNDTLTFEDAAPSILDSGTAVGLNTYNLDLRKDQRRVIPFDSMRPIYQKLEVGDTMNIVDWPSGYKVQGKAVASTDIWMVSSANKTGPDKTSIQVMEVS